MRRPKSTIRTLFRRFQKRLHCERCECCDRCEYCEQGRYLWILMQRNLKAREIPNNDGLPCVVCGVTLCKKWKYYLETGRRVWLCTGVFDTVHRNARRDHTCFEWSVAQQKRDKERARLGCVCAVSPTEAVHAVCDSGRRARWRTSCHHEEAVSSSLAYAACERGQPRSGAKRCSSRRSSIFADAMWALSIDKAAHSGR